MIAVDTNILIYAHRKDSPWHTAASNTIKGLAEGLRPWLIPWPCLHEFIAIVTHARIYRPPSTIAQAFAQIEAWLNSPALALGSEGAAYFAQLKRIGENALVTGPMIHDARIAALCVEHDVDELWSADRDFSRFGEIRTRNPLQ
jgi:uncharacterized protein